MYKQRLGILILFLIMLLGINGVKAFEIESPLFEKVIYLDAGHGGADPGAMYKSLMEKDINLEIAQKLEQKLTNLGAIVYQTRYDDYDLSVPYAWNRKRSDLSRRGNIINKSMCDLYLSLHLNAETSNKYGGAQVFYDDINKHNLKIAKIFQADFKKKLYSKRNYKKVNDLYLSKRVERPGVLLELGFLTNANDRYLLKTKSYQEKVVNVITTSVISYFTN